ncbi:MAG: acriflavin resistance protein [Alteromonadaceae bacterium]|nr:MAG: acriflavin resistance protein [Alteromonadaceae bacterium]
MDIANYFADNHHHLYFLIAGLAFVVELAVMGLSGPLLFFAIAAFITGLLASIGLISGWETEIFTLAVITAVIAVALWKPLKAFQSRGGGADNSSDMIGQQVPSSSTINPTSGSIRYSGINWNARLDPSCDVDSIADATMCEITGMSGNVVIVKPL